MVIFSYKIRILSFILHRILGYRIDVVSTPLSRKIGKWLYETISDELLRREGEERPEIYKKIEKGVNMKTYLSEPKNTHFNPVNVSSFGSAYPRSEYTMYLKAALKSAEEMLPIISEGYELKMVLEKEISTLKKILSGIIIH